MVGSGAAAAVTKSTRLRLFGDLAGFDYCIFSKCASPSTVRPYTASPGLRFWTLAPTDTTSPEKSVPMVIGTLAIPCKYPACYRGVEWIYRSGVNANQHLVVIRHWLLNIFQV